MSEREFNMRLNCAYEGDNNTVRRLEVEHKVNGEWKPLELGLASPGFDIFVYSMLTCQHMYFRVNCAERGLALNSAKGSIFIGTGNDWKIETLQVDFSGELGGSHASREDIEFIVSRMKQCPVSCNIREIPGAVTTVTLK